MKNKLVKMIAVASMLMAGCTTGSEYKLVWSDEFDYTGLPDQTKWSYDTAGNTTGWGNNEAQHYTSGEKKNSWVENGKLSINTLIDSMRGKRYTSARLITKGKGDWLYGKIEVNAKIPTGLGTWPAIWMLPTDWEYGGWPLSGEIDIMENVGLNPDTIVGSAHTGSYYHSIGTQKNATIYCPTSYTEFHTYGLEWEADEYRLYLDGKHYFTFKNEHNTFKEWPFDKRFHLILNVAFGGSWGGMKGVSDEGFPKTMEVDWVRVYQKETK